MSILIPFVRLSTASGAQAQEPSLHPIPRGGDSEKILIPPASFSLRPYQGVPEPSQKSLDPETAPHHENTTPRKIKILRIAPCIISWFGFIKLAVLPSFCKVNPSRR